MGIRAALVELLERPVAATEAVAAFSTTPTTVSAVASPSASTFRAQAAALSIVRRVPAVRRAEHAIAGTLSGFPFAAYQGGVRLPADDRRVSWLRQPSPTRTLEWLLRRTYQDGIWHDRAVWKITDRALGSNLPVKFERVHPDRIQAITEPTDPDTVAAWIVDGVTLDPGEFRARYLLFDFGGLGGLRTYGAPLLELYADLQAAAGNYARAPHPKAVLMNEGGVTLDDDEVDALLAEWEEARNTSSTGYLDGLKYETFGWNAEQLQLTEAREHAALEVARLFALPAFALDAKSGDPMTYSTIVDRRRDLVASLRPWARVVEATLSMDDRTSSARGLVLPFGVTVQADPGDYLDDNPLTRMQTWVAATSGDNPILTRDEARALEPLARNVI